MASSKGKRDLEGQIRAKYFRAKIRNGHERSILQKTSEHLDQRAVYELEGHLRIAKEMVETYRTCRLISGHCHDAVPPTKEDFQGCLNEINQFTHPWAHFANYTIESWAEMDNIRRNRQAASLQRPHTSQSVPGRQPDTKTLRKMFLNQTIRPKTAAGLMLRRAKEDEERKKQLKLRPMTTDVPRDQDTWYKPRRDRSFTVQFKGARTMADQDAMFSIQDSLNREKDVRALRKQFKLPDDYTPSPRVLEYLQKHKRSLTPDNASQTKIASRIRKSAVRKPLHVQPNLADVKEEVTTTLSGLTRMPITTMLHSIDRLPESQTEEDGDQLNREAIESLLRPDIQISAHKDEEKEELVISECQSFESVSEISSDEETKGDQNKRTKRRRAKVKKKKGKDKPHDPCLNTPEKEDISANDTLLHSELGLANSTVQTPLQDSKLNQSKPRVVKLTFGADTKEERAIDETDHINRPQSSRIYKIVDFEKENSPQESQLSPPEPSSHDVEHINIHIEEPDQEAVNGDTAALEGPNTALLQRRALNKTALGSTIHASSIIIKEDEKDITDMNMRSLENPAFLASLTLEQHEALQEKLERRKKPAEERTRFYVHPEKRHRKEEMFLMKRHNLLHRQIQLPDYGHQDEIVTPQVRIVYSKADKQQALDFLTKENTAKVINAKLRHDTGDLQQRVDFFIQRIEKFLKDNAEKEPHMTLVDQL